MIFEIQKIQMKINELRTFLGFSRFAFKEDQDNSFEEGGRKIQSASAAMNKVSKLTSLSAKRGA